MTLTLRPEYRREHFIAPREQSQKFKELPWDNGFDALETLRSLTWKDWAAGFALIGFIAVVFVSASVWG